MANDLEIRQLGPDDIALMDAMRTTLLVAFDEIEIYARPNDRYLRRLLASESFIAVAAIVHSEVIGGLAAYELVKYEQERSEIYVYDLAVAEPHRRHGVATGLMEKLKEIAAARGAHMIFIQADQNDAPAVALYTKLGRREDVAHFDIEVFEVD